MGLAIDSIAGQATMAASPVYKAVTMAAGDSLTVRNFSPPAYCKLEEVLLDGTGTPVSAEITSPLLHDNVRGIQVASSQVPSQLLIPTIGQEMLHPQDTLAVNLLGTASDPQSAVIRLYYSDLPGAAARLAMPGDIDSRIRHIKGIEVDIGAASAANTWYDTLINKTENLLAANTDYAILGYTVSAAIAAIAIKAQETGNLRIAGPAVTDSSVTRSYFADISMALGTPHIPIFNSANINNVYVSGIDIGTTAAPNVYLICAELA